MEFVCLVSQVRCIQLSGDSDITQTVHVLMLTNRPWEERVAEAGG
jgi:hypothetical protein